MVSNTGEKSARFSVSTSGPRLRRGKENEIDNMEDSRPFELIPNVSINSTAGVGHQRVHCFERQTIRSYYMGI